VNMKKSSFNLIFGLVLTCILTFLFFFPHLLKGKIPIPADSLLGLYHPFRDNSYTGYTPGRFPVKNPLITDPVLQTYSWRALTIDNIKEGNLPLWNPYSFSGQPLLANIQSAPFQVTNILFFIFPFKIAWGIQVILTSILTSLFMFLFLKDLKLASIASVFGAVILPFTGFFIAWLTWGTVIASAMWLPLTLLSINKLKAKVSGLWFLILVFTLVQSLLSGHWQTAFYVSSCAFFYFLFLLLKSRNLRGSLVIFAAFILAVLIAGVQLVPSLEFIKYSARNIDQGYYPQRPDWFLPPQHLIQLVAPDFFGNPAKYNYWGIWNYAEFVSFIGIVPFVFVLVSFLKKESKTFFFVILAAVSLMLALANPISKIPYVTHVPLVSSMQPSRIILLFVFSLTVLAAYGFDYFLKEKLKFKIFFPAIIVLIVLLALALYTFLQKDSFPLAGNIDARSVALRNLVLPITFSLTFLFLMVLRFAKISKKIIILAIFLITLADLYRFGYKFTPFSKLSQIFPKTETTAYLASQEKPFRILSTDRRLMHPNISGVYQIESADGYDPLYLQKYGQLVSVWQTSNPKVASGSFNRIITPQKYDSKLVDLLNVKYILSFDEIESPNLIKVFEEGETKVYENLRVLPRAFFAEEIVKAASDKEELAKILDDSFNLSTSATSYKFSFEKQNILAKVNFEKYTDQVLVLKTVTDKESPLIISNVFYPGWQAYIDGKKTDIHEVDYMFQSVIIPEGRHEVKFQFRPKSFYNGLYLSILGLFGAILISIFLWKRKYR